jgi:hypothetical protein
VIRTALEAFTAETRPRPRLPLFSVGAIQTIEDWDKAMEGFGED